MTFYDNVIQVFKQLSNLINVNTIVIIGAGLMLLLIISAALIVRFSYDAKLLRGIKKLNKYFMKNPYINEDNLVEINKRIKALPRIIRYSWQEYVLNRDGLPSKYINKQNCLEGIDKVSFGNAVNISKNFTIILAILIALITSGVVSSFSVLDALIYIITFPLFMLLIGYVSVVVIQVITTQKASDLNYEFTEFVRFLNKAVTTMPSFIDYEVLFTKKEIKDGIPVLQDYLEKKAFEDEKALKEAEENKVFEKFDFDELGIELSILMDRAMREAEKYFNARRLLTEKLNGKTNELNNFDKNFNEVTKDFERKAQTHRENMAQLNDQLNETTIQIEANYIKKRYNEEQQKLQQLEKDYDLAANRFYKQQSEMQEEAEAIRNEIEVRKKTIENSMKSEGKTYANRVYGIINDMIATQNEPVFRQLEEDKINLQTEVELLNQTLSSKQVEIDDKKVKIEDLEKDLMLKLAQIEAIGNVKDYFSSREFRERIRNSNKVSLENVLTAFEDSDDLKKKLDEAEEKLKSAREKELVLQEQESQLIAKIKKQESVAKPITLDVKPSFSTYDSLQELEQTIEQENKNYLNKQGELEKTVDDTLHALKDDSKEVTKETKNQAKKDEVTKEETANKSASKTDSKKAKASADTAKSEKGDDKPKKDKKKKSLFSMVSKKK